MSREIKFRAWCHLSEKMVPPSEVEEHTIENVTKDFEWSVMQFTGLKDKNGVEIYEGDIVESNSHGWERHKRFISEVVWGPKRAGFCIKHRFKTYNVSSGKPIVIGNIHQNPELLTQ